LECEKPYTYISGLPDSICPNMDSLADANIVSYGRVFDGTLDPSDKTKIIFFPVINIELFKEILADIKSRGYNNIMIHLEGEYSDSPFALKIFEEVKNIKLNENAV